MSTGRRTRALGMSTAGLLVTLGVLAVLGIGGWTGWCYYQVLEREGSMEKAMEGVSLFRDHQPTQARIQQRALEKIRAKGGQLSLGDVRVHVEPLTPKSAARLPDFERQKLSLSCKLHGIQQGADARLDRIRQAAEGATWIGRDGRRRPAPAAPPAAASGRGCTADLLKTLGWTLVHVEATALVKVGWVKRRVKVERIFFRKGPVPSARPAAPKADEDDGDDE